MMKKTFFSALPALILVTVACDPNAGKPVTPTPPAGGGGVKQAVTGVSNQVQGMREVMKAKVGERNVIAVLIWRPYDAAKDSSVGKWYGDMASPPPKYVADSLIVSIDGKGVVIPRSNYRYLASQWMNDSKSLGIYSQGKNLGVYVDVGDGAEGWTASYVINAATGSLVSHQVQDGPEFHNQAP